MELDGQAFFNNLKFFRQRIGENTRLCAVVKANAYGHGIAQMAGLALDAGVDCFAVHSGDEVVLIGRQGEEQITAGDIAERIGTIHYEVVTRLHPSIPRLVV